MSSEIDLSAFLFQKKLSSNHILMLLMILSPCIQVFKEVLRYAPPVTGVIRKSLNDIVINGYKIPAGAAIRVSTEVSTGVSPRYSLISL